MAFENLMDYGLAGLFIAYLIYDKKFVTTHIVKTLDKIADKVGDCPHRRGE